MFAPAHHSFWLLIYLFLSYFVLSLPFMFVRLDLFFLCIHSSIVVSPARPVGKYPSFWFESIPHACCHTHNCFGLPGDQITMSLTWPFFLRCYVTIHRMQEPGKNLGFVSFSMVFLVQYSWFRHCVMCDSLWGPSGGPERHIGDSVLPFFSLRKGQGVIKCVAFRMHDVCAGKSNRSSNKKCVKTKKAEENNCGNSDLTVRGRRKKCNRFRTLAAPTAAVALWLSNCQLSSRWKKLRIHSAAGKRR